MEYWFLKAESLFFNAWILNLFLHGYWLFLIRSFEKLWILVIIHSLYWIFTFIVFILFKVHIDNCCQNIFHIISITKTNNIFYHFPLIKLIRTIFSTLLEYIILWIWIIFIKNLKWINQEFIVAFLMRTMFLSAFTNMKSILNFWSKIHFAINTIFRNSKFIKECIHLLSITCPI